MTSNAVVLHGERVAPVDVATEQSLPLNTIAGPGVYDNLPEDIYHAHSTSLSCSGAKLLRPPSVPAKFRYAQDHDPRPKKAWDLGKVAHRLVLGAGTTIVVVDAADWRTNAAKEKRDEARADGKTPILAAEYKIVEEMAAAIRTHELAVALLDGEHGIPERSLFWEDAQTGVTLRARPDWLSLAPTASGRLIVPDYKTAKSAARPAFEKAAFDYGYFCQADWYPTGIKALGLADDVVLVFIVQETEPPYLVNLVEPSSLSLMWAAEQNRAAIDLYATCVADNHWPGFGPEPELISLPGWVERDYLAGRS